jgi:hypothetical protein
MACIARASGCLGRPRSGVRLPRALEFDEAVDDFWPALDGARGQGILRVAAQRNLASHAAGRRY